MREVSAANEANAQPGRLGVSAQGAAPPASPRFWRRRALRAARRTAAPVRLAADWSLAASRGRWDISVKEATPETVSRAVALAAGGQKPKYGALRAGWMPATPDEQARRAALAGAGPLPSCCGALFHSALPPVITWCFHDICTCLLSLMRTSQAKHMLGQQRRRPPAAHRARVAALRAPAAPGRPFCDRALDRWPVAGRWGARRGRCSRSPRRGPRRPSARPRRRACSAS